MLKKYQSLSRIKQIAVAVVFIHGLIIFALSIHHLATFRKIPKRPIIVRTVAPSLTPNSVSPKIAAAKPSSTKSTPQKPSQPKQKSTPVAQKEKAVSAKPAPVQKSSKPVESEESALKEIASAFDSLANPSTYTPKPLLSVPSKVEPAKTEIAEDISSTYSEQLIASLQNSLDLPEFGEVKIRLTIDRLGSLLSCDILETKSKKNGEFLKKRLPELTLPCFNDYDLLENSKEFTITFRNVENY